MKILHKFEDTIILCSGRALILPNRPDNLPISSIQNHMAEGEQQDVEKFGLFEAAAPNYTTYYPEVTAEDFIVKEGDLFKPLVRALSQVVVHKQYNPVDFGQGTVLKDSQSLLYGQTIYIDHETATGNALGSISETSWQEAYKAKGGILVPAGINAQLQIDGKSHPNLVRKMQMKPPAIHSLSVTVAFGWEPSHKGMPLEEFMRKIGTRDEKGKLYTRVANQVKVYKEISLVAHGADPYAQLINDQGQITNPKYADLVYNSAEGKPIGVKYHFLDFKDGLVQNSADNTIPDDINNIDTPSQTANMKKETLLLLAAAFSIANADSMDETALAEAIEPKIAGYITANSTASTQLTTATTRVTELEGQLQEEKDKVTGLETKLKDAPELAALGESYLKDTRVEAIRLATVLNGNKAPAEATLNLLNGANGDTLNLLLSQYKEQVDAKFPIACKKCGSTEVNRASAKLEDPQQTPGNDPKDNYTTLRDRVMAGRFAQADNMHGTPAKVK